MPCRFRVKGVKSVEWWDPLTGERSALHEWRNVEDGGVEVCKRLGPGESGFVVFSRGASSWCSSIASFFKPVGSRVPRDRISVEGPWKVSFDPAWGGPEGEVEFKTLEDWTKRPEWGIQHYSGIATYRKKVTGKEVPTHISLGSVVNLARVKLNGKDLGSVWCWPWRVAVPEGAWKEGENLLEIEVANLWANRLIGDDTKFEPDCEWKIPANKNPREIGIKEIPQWVKDGKPSPTGRHTFTTWKHWDKNDKLQPSGLLGPVKVDLLDK